MHFIGGNMEERGYLCMQTKDVAYNRAMVRERILCMQPKEVAYIGP